MNEDPQDAMGDGCVFRELEDALVGISGDDCRTWLNGQVTNDVAKMDPYGCVYALVVSVKGRIQTDLWIHGDAEQGFLLSLPPERTSAIQDTFEGQIIMEDVEVQQDGRRIVSVQGPRSSEVVGRLPTLRAYPAPRLGGLGYDLLVPSGDIAQVTAALEAQGAHQLSGDQWEQARVRAGIPAFGSDFDQNAYPQEAGLKDRAVSFLKGCYVGQEVVCTLENRGRLRRRLVRLESENKGTVGAELTLDDEPTGRVTSGVTDGRTWWGLGYVRAARAVPGTVVRMPEGPARVVGLVGATAAVT